MAINRSFRTGTVLGAYFFRAVAIAANTVTLPLLLLRLPGVDYAALAVLTGLEGWALLFDFGMGFAVQNAVAKGDLGLGTGNSLFKTALVYTSCSCGAAALLVWLGSSFFSSFLLEKMQLPCGGIGLFRTAALFFLLGAFGSLGTKILIGRDQGGRAYLLQTFARLLSVSCLIFCCRSGTLSLEQCILFLFGIPAVCSFCVTLWIIASEDWGGSLDLSMMKQAIRFCFFSVTAAFVSLSDVWVISRTLSVEEIVRYNVFCKLFGIAFFLYAPFLQSFMPRCAKMLASGFVSQAVDTVRRSCRLLIGGAVVFTAFVLLFSSWFERMFSVSLPCLTSIFFGLYLCIRIPSDFYAAALQSGGILTPFFRWVPVQGVLSVGLQYVLSLYMGVAGIVAGIALSYLLTVFRVLPKALGTLRITPRGAG